MMWRCKACGAAQGGPGGRCDICKAWNTISAFEEGLIRSSAPRYAETITVDRKKRISTGLQFLDDVLSGGFVEGYSILFAGRTGAGKSTLINQIIARYLANLLAFKFSSLDEQGHFTYSSVKALYASSEEEDQDIVDRMNRLKLPLDHTMIHSESSGEVIFQNLTKENPDLFILDSIQAVTYRGHPLRSAQGTIEIVSYVHRWAHENGKVAIMVCQENKDGDAAGPMFLAHNVDAILHLESCGAENHRLLTVVKNRKGPAPDHVILSMTEKGLISND